MLKTNLAAGGLARAQAGFVSSIASTWKLSCCRGITSRLKSPERKAHKQQNKQQAAAEPIGGEKEMAIWIDEYQCSSVDGIGFLVRIVDNNHGSAEHYCLDNRARCTNMSHEPKLHGWCGETNNISVYAEGLARISRRTKNDRICLTQIEKGSQEEAKALEELGYPELE